MSPPLILHIDDAPDLPAGLSEALEEDGYELLHTADPEEAMRIVEESSPALVMMELELRSCDGPDLMAGICDPSFSSVPVLVVTTARRDSALHGEAIALGVVDFLTKPVRGAALLEVIHEIAPTAGRHRAGSGPRGQRPVGRPRGYFPCPSSWRACAGAERTGCSQSVTRGCAWECSFATARPSGSARAAGRPLRRRCCTRRSAGRKAASPSPKGARSSPRPCSSSRAIRRACCWPVFSTQHLPARFASDSRSANPSTLPSPTNPSRQWRRRASDSRAHRGSCSTASVPRTPCRCCSIPMPSTIS